MNKIEFMLNQLTSTINNLEMKENRNEIEEEALVYFRKRRDEYLKEADL